MQEDFLHYIWKHKKFRFNNLETTTGESIVVTSVGQHNFNSGPDFFNAKIKVGDQLWAGNVEIHIKSSDWFLHSHEQDQAYDNVILHVVYEHDREVHTTTEQFIPCLELKNRIPKKLKQNYSQLITNNNWIPCENQLQNVPNHTVTFWLQKGSWPTIY